MQPILALAEAWKNSLAWWLGFKVPNSSNVRACGAGRLGCTERTAIITEGDLGGGERLGMDADKDVHLEISRHVLDSVVITTMVRAFELCRGGSKTSPVDRNWGDAHINAWIWKQWYVAIWVFDTWPLKKSAERLSNPRTVHFEAGSNMVITASSNGIILSYPRTSQPYTDRWSEKSTLGELKRSRYASRYHVTPYSSDRVWGGTSRKRE
ncbi:hypothetical protein BJY52DRAFT_1221812 [Lactarius psammicola]|nr:hypothetical protein BJY52DRAFT_1221812 [Lactarius psammicola]